MKIGPYLIKNKVFVAPMAGVTDRPFRQLCKELGAGYAVSEMAASNPFLWNTQKSMRRTNHDGEMEPKVVQIAGADSELMVEAAQFNVKKGAQIIDINMGCPTKKVCNKLCGSALLNDEKKVTKILKDVVESVDVPVTLKFRTGWDKKHKNAVKIAQIAQDCGVSMLTLHGRTREDGFTGSVDYESIARVKAQVEIPVIANGDIDSPQKAKSVLSLTGADAIMIGRAAQGRPWIFREVDYFLRFGKFLPNPSINEVKNLMIRHLSAHYSFYGKNLGVQTARKHIGWYVKNLYGGELFRSKMNLIQDYKIQLFEVNNFFESQKIYGDYLKYLY